MPRVQNSSSFPFLESIFWLLWLLFWLLSIFRVRKPLILLCFTIGRSAIRIRLRRMGPRGVVRNPPNKKLHVFT